MKKREINQIISDLVVLNSIQRTVKLITGKKQVVNIEQKFKPAELMELAKRITFGNCEVSKLWIKIELDSCFVIILSNEFKIKNGTRRV